MGAGLPAGLELLSYKSGISDLLVAVVLVADVCSQQWLNQQQSYVCTN